jgi:Peptidase C39 family
MRIPLNLMIMLSCLAWVPAGEERDDPALPNQAFWQVGSACGPNALYCMLIANDKDVDYQELLAFLSPPSDGNSMQELADASHRWKLDVGCYKSDRRGIGRFETPFIAHLDVPGGHHYALITGRNDRGFEVLDPEAGEIKAIDDMKFHKAWSGYVISTKGHAYERYEWIIVMMEFPAVSFLVFHLLRRRRVPGGFGPLPAAPAKEPGR